MGGRGLEREKEGGSFRLELRVALVTADVARACAPIRVCVSVCIVRVGARVRVRRLVHEEHARVKRRYIHRSCILMAQHTARAFDSRAL